MYHISHVREVINWTYIMPGWNLRVCSKCSNHLAVPSDIQWTILIITSGRIPRCQTISKKSFCRFKKMIALSSSTSQNCMAKSPLSALEILYAQNTIYEFSLHPYLKLQKTATSTGYKL